MANKSLERDPIRRCPMKRPPILKQLQNIMREYPEDVQILHELVQNAEDANATVMKIMYDQRQINPPGKLGKFLKSPALCIFNDGVFDEDDWDGIKSVCLSHKEEKTDKIGRFGQGFKSVFHLTDNPVVVSGDTMLIIDPLNVDRECGMVFLSKIENISKTGIFKSFDFNHNAIRNNYYPATLFWFPLRSQESELSKNVCTDSKMTHILSLFEEDAAIVLLFLKYLTKIEIHNPTQSPNPFKYIKICYAKNKRSDLQSFWSSMDGNTETEDRATKTFSIVIDADIHISTRSGTKKEHWTICHYHASHSDMSVELGRLASDKEVACLPYVGVAYKKSLAAYHTGRVFNFLPLPATCKTNLPVHVNGNFALSQNRRHLKLSDERSADKFIKWNEGLIKEVLSESYMTLVHHLIENSQKNKNTKELINDVYKCLPNLNVTEEIWQTLVDRIYLKIIEKAVFFSDLGHNGTWVTKNKAIICNVDGLVNCSPDQHQSIKTTVKYVLLNLQIAVVDVRQNMMALVKTGNLRHIMPHELVTMIRNSPQSYLNLQWARRVALLNYLIDDSSKEFQGLQLLPLHCCKFTTFNEEEEKVFVHRSEEVNLFIGVENRFISQDLPDGLFKDLRSMALKNMFQLTTLKLEDISSLLTYVFNNHCYISEKGKYIPKCKPSPLNKVWIADVWKMITRYKNLTHKNRTSKMGSFDNIPLIPQLTADETCIENFNILKGDYIVKEYKGKGFSMSKPLPVDIIAMLEAEGIAILNPNSILDDADIIGSYIKYPTEGGILEFCEQRPDLKKKYVTYIGVTGNMYLPMDTTAIPFGQREELVTRLKSILQNYPKNHSVLKEILQNADDAGASEVHFLYDMRQHQTETIFSDNWKVLHGPSLCVFNDACFTENDKEGIQKLGIGSKSGEPMKTGQFGIGFNAVYHITDAPAFMSKGDHAALGGMYCVLDPHCRYAPTARFDNPGMLMKLQKLIEIYPDVFNTFLTTTELKREHGTWFRLPLRNVEMTRSSDIRNTPFTHSDMKRLLSDMNCDIEESLLFLLNIKKITLSYVNQQGTHVILNRVELSHSVDIQRTHLNFKKRFKEYNDMLKQPSIDIKSICIEEFRYFHEIKSLLGKESIWLVVQALGFSEPEMIDHRLKTSLQEKEISIIPRGGVAIRILPTAGTKKFKSKAFCLLPLNIETGLTGHVNGHFCVDMSRNKLWGSDVEFISDVRGIWNLELIRFNIAYAYASCFEYMKEISSRQYNIGHYLKFIPVFNEAKSYFWRELIYYLFLQSKTRRLEIFPICPSITSSSYVKSYLYEYLQTTKWACRQIKREMPVLIDDLSDQINSEDACSFRTICVELGMKLTCSPMVVKDTLLNVCTFHHAKYTEQSDSAHIPTTQICICIESISPKATLDFFKSYKLNVRGRFEKDSFNKLKLVDQIKQILKYCLKEKKWDICCGAPLLLNQMSDILDIKDRNDLILTEFYYLLPKSAEKFVHKSLLEIFNIYRDHFIVLSIDKFAELLPKTLEIGTYKLDKPRRMVESDCRQWFNGFWTYIDSERLPLTDLSQWCLLPVNLMSIEWLFPVKMCRYTIDINTFNVNPKLHSVLSTMSLPTSCIKSRVLLDLQAKYHDIDTTLKCLHYWRKEINPGSKLTSEQCMVVLMYLIKDICSDNREQIQKLKDLPLFPTLDRGTLSVSGKRLLIFDNKIKIPTNGLLDLFDNLNILVLQDFKGLHVSILYELLQCEMINAGTLYGNFILKHFHYISDERNRIIHLEFIRDNLLHDLNLSPLLPAASLIYNGNSFQKVSDFFDKNNELFSTMCTTPEFLPHPFNTICWRNFMITAGLKIQMSEDIIHRFAKRIADSGLQKETYSRSEMILNEFLNYVQTSPIHVHFLSELSVIKFIAVEKNEHRYEKIHPSYRTGLRLISYKTAISNHCRNLAWTSADILPSYAMPYNSKIEKQLNIRDPDFLTVVQHAKNICLKLVKTCEEHDQSFIKDVFSSVYEYFSKHLDKISNVICIPIVHVRKYKKFVRANQLIVNFVENDEIVPYLVKLPIEYGTYHELFAKLGMRTDPNINSYCKVLEQIYQHTRERNLSPKEIHCTKKAMQGLMKSLQNLESPFTELEVNVLYLLSETNVLMPSNNLYYDSLEIPRESLKGNTNLSLIARLDCFGFNVDELYDLFSMLPAKHHPISIKSILTEKLTSFPLKESQTVLDLQECLTSDTFITAVLRFVKHDQQLLKNDFNTSTMKTVFAKLRRVRLLAVSELKTSLVDEDGRECSTTEKVCFYLEPDDLMYIDDMTLRTNDWLQTYDVQLEEVIRIICNYKFLRGTLLKILNKVHAQLNVIQERLTQIGIPFIEGAVLNEAWFPCPGSFVPEDLHSFIRMALRPITVKEYAVMKYPRNNCNIDGNVQYIYVIITSISHIFGSLCYKINAGDKFNGSDPIPEDEILEIYTECSENETKGESSQSSAYKSSGFAYSSSYHSTSNSARNFHCSGKPNPQIHLGRKWLEQANYDFKAGTITFAGIESIPFKGYNWICIQCQQAAEKAIKSARYATNAVHLGFHTV
ncbi:sacsin-like isoform X2 [Mytilus californianus]|uniref:sacsin-like isoform X2 n=1 Tax=Mytilus californianus TaxID=6549 RepID=UPI002247F484|nr:sacsin-like isoform X2 [Mytilus californianus]